MLYLLIKNKNNELEVISSSTFGFETWKIADKIYLKRKRKYWYVCITGEYYNDCQTLEEYKLDVILEGDKQMILDYIKINKPEILNRVEKQIDGIILKNILIKTNQRMNNYES